MNSNELQKHIEATYFTLRIGLAILAVLFPFILSLGGYLGYQIPLRGSMSEYYHANQAVKCPYRLAAPQQAPSPPAMAATTKSCLELPHATPTNAPMRDWFVGILFAVGAFLYLYKGFSTAENIALNVAGILAWGIALFPMSCSCEEVSDKFSAHGICAVGFFACIAFVSIFCSGNTLHLMQDEARRKRFRAVYKVLGLAMLILPATAFVLSIVARLQDHAVFYVEAAGIFAFAAYWLTKSRELTQTQADHRALQGAMPPAT